MQKFGIRQSPASIREAWSEKWGVEGGGESECVAVCNGRQIESVCGVFFWSLGAVTGIRATASAFTSPPGR